MAKSSTDKLSITIRVSPEINQILHQLATQHNTSRAIIVQFKMLQKLLQEDLVQQEQVQLLTKGRPNKGLTKDTYYVKKTTPEQYKNLSQQELAKLATNTETIQQNLNKNNSVTKSQRCSLCHKPSTKKQLSSLNTYPELKLCRDCKRNLKKLGIR